MAVRLMLADDHRMLREGLRRSMTDQGFDVVALARDGEEAVRLAEEVRPDVILMDVSMPELDGVAACRKIHASLPVVKVVMLTVHEDVDVVVSAIRAGASGYLVKDCTTEEIASAVRMTASGATALASQMAAAMLRDVRRLSGQAGDRAPVLTEREEETLRLLADGAWTSEVAARMSVEHETVEDLLASIRARLGVGESDDDDDDDGPASVREPRRPIAPIDADSLRLLPPANEA